MCVITSEPKAVCFHAFFLFRASLLISQETKYSVSIIFLGKHKNKKNCHRKKNEVTISTVQNMTSILLFWRGRRTYIQRVKPQTLWIISEAFFLARLRALLFHFACVFTGSVYKVPNSSTLCDSDSNTRARGFGAIVANSTDSTPNNDCQSNLLEISSLFR